MVKPLYFAPINYYGNNNYRHFLLKYCVDYVFTELIMVSRLPSQLNKFVVYPEDLDKTIFQIGAGTTNEIDIGVNEIIRVHPNAKEINLNMGCPRSSMQKTKVCGGILQDKELIKKLATHFAKICPVVSSIKIRLGTSPENVEIDDYVNIISCSGIKKIYIHARTLRHPYEKQANYAPLIGLKDRFPDVTFIFNGDIDSYETYEQVENYCDGVMIGRAALSNPLIFEQIKNKIFVSSGPYDPFTKDPNILRKNGKSYLNEDKKNAILEFLKTDGDKSQKEANIRYLLKGICKESLIYNGLTLLCLSK